MRKLQIASLLLLACLSANADPITRQQAEKQAAAFLLQQNPQATLKTAVAHKAPRKVNGQASTDQAYYYVFNTEDSKGFVVVSGDDMAVPILAYSTEGSFNENDIPDNMRAWLKGYEKEIAWAQENGYQPASTTTSNNFNKFNGPVSAFEKVKLTATKKDVAYMVKTTWDQGSPYYNQCRFNNRSCYTGCVATAMAQVMYYWGVTGRNGQKFQHGCTALDGYTTETNKYSVGALSAVSQFSWSDMTTSAPSTTNAKNAVAQLMRYCGQSVFMDYTPSGSGASSLDIPAALINNFGYDKGAVHVERSKFSVSEWEDLIYNELANGRPVLMDGVDFDELVGHEFICDGYQASSNKFHFNWGWSGSYNSTYCALSALAPGGTGSGGTSSGNGNYTPMQGAVIGIQPPIDDSERETSSLDQLTIEALYLISPNRLSRDARSQDANTVRTRGLIFNNTTQTRTFEFCLGIFNEDGEMVDNTTVRNYGKIEPGDGYYFNNDFSFGGELPYGTYKIVPICRESGTDEWYAMNGGNKFYVQAVLTENSIELTPSVSLEFSNFQCKSSFFSKTNTVDIKNNGLEDFTSEAYLLIDGELAVYICPGDLSAGETKTYTIPYTSGNLQNANNVSILADGYGVGQYYNNTSDYADVEWDMDWDGYIDGDNNLYADSYKAKFYLDNKGSNAYSHTVTATLFEKGKSVSTGTSQTKTVTAAAKSRGEVEFEFTNITYGKTYDLQIKYYEKTAEVTETLSDYECAFTMKKGIVVIGDGEVYYPDGEGIISIPEDAIYVDARYSDKATSIGNGGNTNTLYLLKANANVPQTLEGKNVIKGNTAEMITIDDALEFQSPIDFTAENIEYKRTFTAGYDGTNPNWSTVVVPFDVNTVTNNATQKDIDWFHSNSDKGKYFWLMDFESESDEKVNFTYAEEMKAYTPYIITVASDAWGEKWNLVGKEISFKGQNANVKAGNYKAVTDKSGKFDFIGRTYSAQRNTIYALNENGTAFDFTKEDSNIAPFRAYFVGYYDNVQQLSIGFVDQNNNETTLVEPTNTNEPDGDVNGDGSVNIADVTALVDIILGNDNEAYDHTAADIDGDNNITITDVTALVNIILSMSAE